MKEMARTSNDLADDRSLPTTETLAPVLIIAFNMDFYNFNKVSDKKRKIIGQILLRLGIKNQLKIILMASQKNVR